MPLEVVRDVSEANSGQQAGGGSAVPRKGVLAKPGRAARASAGTLLGFASPGLGAAQPDPPSGDADGHPGTSPDRALLGSPGPRRPTLVIVAKPDALAGWGRSSSASVLPLTKPARPGGSRSSTPGGATRPRRTAHLAGSALAGVEAAAIDDAILPEVMPALPPGRTRKAATPLPSWLVAAA